MRLTISERIRKLSVKGFIEINGYFEYRFYLDVIKSHIAQLEKDLAVSDRALERLLGTKLRAEGAKQQARDELEREAKES